MLSIEVCVMVRSSIAGAVVLLSVFTGCAMNPGAIVDAPPSKAQTDALQQVRSDYAAGRYGDVVSDVARSSILADAPRATRIEAMKLQAFSYCLTRHPALCEDQFRRILALDPAFMLKSTEQGHPQWQPAFDAAHTG